MSDDGVSEEELAALLGDLESNDLFAELPISDVLTADKKAKNAPKPQAPQEEKTMSQADIDALLAGLASGD